MTIVDSLCESESAFWEKKKGFTIGGGVALGLYNMRYAFITECQIILFESCVTH